ncbi:MAG: flagellar filament capping protein FliD [Oscillospiraceae bacterium]
MPNNISFNGLNSGLDTESIIKAMMTSYQTKIDNQSKKLTKLQWQQEAYQDITKKLTEFQNKYFDVLKRDTYLMSSSTFNKYKTDITSTGKSTNGLTVSTSGSASVGSHKLKVSQLAEASTVKGNEITPANFKLDADKAIASSSYQDTTDNGVTTRKYEFSLNVQVGSVTKKIDFAAQAEVAADGTVDTSALKQNMLDNLNKELQTGFGYSGKSGAGATGAVDPLTGKEWFLQAEMNADGALSFKVGGGANVTVSENVGMFGLSEPVKSLALSMGSAVTGTNTVNVDVGGVSRTVSFEGVSGTYYSTKNQKGNESILAEYNSLKEAAFRKKYYIPDDAEIDQKALDSFEYTDLQAAKDKNSAAMTTALNEAFDDEGISFTLNNGIMLARKDGQTTEFSFQVKDGGTLGLTKASASNIITSKTTLKDMGIAPDSEGNYSLKINGVEISVGKDSTVDSLVAAVNKSDAGVKMSYSSLTNSFTIESNEMGGAGAVEIEGTDFTKALGLTDDSGEEVNFTLGQNAVVELDGQELYLNGNSYTFEGMTFTFNDDIELGETFTIGVTKSYDDVKQTIKDFVADYNQLIDDVYDYIGNKPKTDSKNNAYEPLTDAEKEEMSEDEIEKWEEAAKVGVLYNDSTVTSIMSKMRSVLYNSVELDNGGKIGLYNLGIKTSTELDDHGKLKIDESTFDKMFEQNADDIVKLFTDPDKGIMKQMKAALDSAVKSTGTVETRGSLIRKAGLADSRTVLDSSIYKEMERINRRISDLNDRYTAREDYWWSVFTNLETMMSDLNSQSNYMASYLGSFGNNNS